MIRTLGSSQKLLGWVLLSIAVLLVSVAFSGYALGQREGAKADAIHESCVAIQNLNGVITESLKRSRKNLTRLAYYREHPADLRFARREINRELRVFRPRTCK